MTRWLARAVVVAVALLLLPACGESPADAYAKITAMAAAGDWGAVYDRTDRRSQGRLEGTLPGGGAGESGREAFARVARIEDHLAARFPRDYEVVSTDVRGDQAMLHLRLRHPAEGEPADAVRALVREDGIWKVTLDAIAPPTPPAGQATAERDRSVECGRLLDVIDRGRRTLKAKRGGADPIATLSGMASALDASGVEAARLELGAVELAGLAKDYQHMAQAVAQAARDMASASRGHDEERAQAAARAYDEAAALEKPILDGVKRACER